MLPQNCLQSPSYGKEKTNLPYYSYIIPQSPIIQNNSQIIAEKPNTSEMRYNQSKEGESLRKNEFQMPTLDLRPIKD